MNFREVTGTRLDWINTGIEHHFSNFLYVDRHGGSSNVLRRIFSLARKLGYHSLLIESIAETDCPLLAEENAALKLRSPDFQKSEVRRLSFFRCPNGGTPVPEDFLGWLVVKEQIAFLVDQEDRQGQIIRQLARQDDLNFLLVHRQQVPLLNDT